MTLIVSALGGWLYPESGTRMTVGESLRMRSGRTLREKPNKNAKVLGVVAGGKEITIVEAPGDGWVKIVVND